MKRTFIYQAIAACFVAFTPVVIAQAEKPMEKAPATTAASGLTELVANVHPVGDSNVKGVVTFQKVPEGVKVTANISGLQPGSKHGFHVHEFGDLTSADATSAGGHFNPEGHEHGLPEQEQRHAGDLGNLEANSEGVATKTITVDNITLGHGQHNILGRAVIVHAKPDDGSQPTGDAGDRIAAGVIGIAQDAKPAPAR